MSRLTALDITFLIPNLRKEQGFSIGDCWGLNSGCGVAGRARDTQQNKRIPICNRELLTGAGISRVAQ